jgi:hypothetical protein
VGFNGVGLEWGWRWNVKICSRQQRLTFGLLVSQCLLIGPVAPPDQAPGPCPCLRRMKRC